MQLIDHRMWQSLCSVVVVAMVGCASATAQGSAAERMTVYSLGWEDRYAVSMSPRRIFGASEAEVREVDDARLVRQIRERTSRLERRDGRDEGPIDGRLLCCLYREDGESDILVFSRLRMEYNGLVYDTDTELLRLVGTTQPEPDRETIERWITIVKKHAEE